MDTGRNVYDCFNVYNVKWYCSVFTPTFTYDPLEYNKPSFIGYSNETY